MEVRFRESADDRLQIQGVHLTIRIVNRGRNKQLLHEETQVFRDRKFSLFLGERGRKPVDSRLIDVKYHSHRGLPADKERIDRQNGTVRAKHIAGARSSQQQGILPESAGKRG